MRWEQKVTHNAVSDIGLRRRNNQDSFAVQLCSEQEVWEGFGHLFVVADGMGGHAVGELASKMAVDTIPLTFYKSKTGTVPEALVESIEHANRAIFERGSQNLDFRRMGTTAVVLVLGPDGATIAHVGDSRCYRIRGARIQQLTFDHSLDWEMQRRGQLKPDEIFLTDAKHVITRSLGPESSVDVDINGPYAVKPGDRFLLCSDGLTGHVRDSEIGMIVRELPPDEASRLLINLANLRGGSDNITVVIADAGQPPNDQPVEDSEPSVIRRVGPVKMLCLAIASAVAALGIALLLADPAVWGREIPGRELWGGILAVLGVLGWLAVFTSSGGKQPDEEENGASQPGRPRVYTSASAKPTREFLAGLAKIETQLRELAPEENWKVDWTAHETAISTARQAIAEKDASQTMSHLGKAIDVLMAGLHHHRRRQRLAQRDEEDQSDG